MGTHCIPPRAVAVTYILRWMRAHWGIFYFKFPGRRWADLGATALKWSWPPCHLAWGGIGGRGMEAPERAAEARHAEARAGVPLARGLGGPERQRDQRLARGAGY